jgi:GTPase SAR1 family protein
MISTESYNALSQWIKDAREFGRSDIGIVVCANKIDLKKDRLISTE